MTSTAARVPAACCVGAARMFPGMFRLLRVQRIFNRLEHAFVIRHHVTRVAGFAVVVLLVGHFSACGYYAVSASACGGAGDDAARAVGGCPSNTWIARARVADGSSVDKCVVVASFRLAAASVESRPDSRRLG